MKEIFEIIMSFGLLIVVIFGLLSVYSISDDLIRLIFTETKDIDWQKLVIEIFGISCLLFMAKNWND